MVRTAPRPGRPLTRRVGMTCDQPRRTPPSHGALSPDPPFPIPNTLSGRFRLIRAHRRSDRAATKVPERARCSPAALPAFAAAASSASRPMTRCVGTLTLTRANQRWLPGWSRRKSLSPALRSRLPGVPYTPVLPNPPGPRADSSSSVASTSTGVSYRANTTCAMRSPRAIGTGSAPLFWRITLSSPR